ncbi:MAG: DUF2520 domain-containing protein [Prevotella sp.]|nr:DUF2520 domain-containing protein [Prevotella sp.]
MDIVFVGAGRLATQFAKALRNEGHCVLAVYSRTMASAQALTAIVGGMATDRIEALPARADAFIVAVKDAVLPALIPLLTSGRLSCPMFHTAGSMPMSVFGSLPYHGVIYPMQTFSKDRDVDFRRIPVFIEASNSLAMAAARTIATSVSDRVTELDGQRRRYLHLAAVFACNFANHCYALAADVLRQHGLSFEDMLPLIDETAQKVHELSPYDAQTGPAVRYDENVINAHLALLADNPRLQEVYTLMSRSIHQEKASSVCDINS